MLPKFLLLYNRDEAASVSISVSSLVDVQSVKTEREGNVFDAKILTFI